MLTQQEERTALRAIYGILSPKHVDAVEDVLQQAKLNAFVKAHQFDGRSKYSTWFHRIAVNHALMHLRKVKSWPHFVTSLQINREEGTESLDVLEYMMSDEPSPEERMLKLERLQLVRKALMKLTPVKRRAILSFYITQDRGQGAGKQHVELPKRSGADKARAFRGLKELKRILREELS